MTTQLRLLGVVLVLVIVLTVAVGLRVSRPPLPPAPPPIAPTAIPVNRNATAPAASGAVVIPVGRERLASAERGLAFTADLWKELPPEAKAQVATLAGIFYFNDCLMADMTNGGINAASNEVRQRFKQTLTRLYPNTLPPGVAERLTKPPERFDHNDPQARLAYERRGYEHPEHAMVDGFDGSFIDRNNLHMSPLGQYRAMEQAPELKRQLQKLQTTFAETGVQDQLQSDLKTTCLLVGSIRTSAYLMYGPASDTSMPVEYKAETDALDQVLQWRLVNMYGLDEARASNLVKAISRMPVKGFTGAGLQPPAWME